jgi:hypothetical protein
MSWVAVAVGGATLVSGYMGAKGQKDAAKAQQQGADQAAQVQWDMYNQSRADNEPFRQAGLTGLQEYMALLGLPTSSVSNASTPTQWFGSGDAPTVNGQLYASDPAYRAAWDQVAGNHYKAFGSGFTTGSDRNAIQGDLAMLYAQNRGSQPQSAGTSLTQAQAFDRFRNTPGYQFGLTEGQRTLESSAAAQGGLFSGKAAKALTKFGQDYADQQGYRPYMNSLASLAGIGQTATSQNNSLGQAAAGNIGQAYMGAANARASGIQGRANAWGDTINGLAGAAGYAYGNRGSWGWGGV